MIGRENWLSYVKSRHFNLKSNIYSSTRNSLAIFLSQRMLYYTYISRWCSISSILLIDSLSMLLIDESNFSTILYGFYLFHLPRLWPTDIFFFLEHLNIILLWSKIEYFLWRIATLNLSLLLLNTLRLFLLIDLLLW